MAARVPPDVRRHIAEAMASPVDSLAVTARKLAEMYRISVSSVYRHARSNGPARRRRAARPEYRDWARAVVAIAHSTPTRRPLPMDLALAAAVESGRVPPAAADMPVGTLYRIAAELGLNLTALRTGRLHADYPMQALVVDGSTSDNLVVEGKGEDGDYIVRLHRRPWPAGGYKNKPLGPERLRLCLYAAWDMCTGYDVARYVPARGENALDTLDFLVWVMSKSDDPRLPVHGVPDDIWADQGALFKHKVSRDLLARLGIRLVDGPPYQKSRMGGVEQTHRTRWTRFERILYLSGRDRFTVAEINERLFEYLHRENTRRKARVTVGERRVSRQDAWIALTNARAQDNRLRLLPDNALRTLAAQQDCKVDSNGIVRWGGKEYQLEGDIAGAWVSCRRPLDDTDTIIATAPDKRQFTGRAYAPRPYGEVRRAPASPLTQLLEDAEPVTGVDLYAPDTGESPGNITTMPVRSAPALPLPDPTVPRTSHPTIEDAMAAFVALYPYPLSAEAAALVRAEIISADLSIAAVSDLAADMARAVSAV